jgi:hypothetical protein
MSGPAGKQSAAIVCHEVAVEHAPILYAERSEPEDAAAIGWQILCGIGSEDWESAQVCALQEVLVYDPSLKPFIDSPAGTVLSH